MAHILTDQINRPVVLPSARNPWTTGVSAILLAFTVGLAVFMVLSNRTPLIRAEARGLYETEGGQNPFNWTGSRVTVPIYETGSTTSVMLTIASGRWEGRPAPDVTLAAGDTELARFTATDTTRAYRFLLPAGTTNLQISTPVARSPGDDRRWLGVQLMDLRAISHGPPTGAITWAVLLALASIPLALGASWCARHGYAAIIAVTLAGLGMRFYRLEQVPAGFFQDEAVSLVDAWSLLRTGHDHLGHPLPIGAFESFGDWVSPLLTYLELPVVALAGPTPLAGRFVAALAGALAVPAIYALARSVQLPEIPSIYAALAAALSPWQIVRGRVATPPALVPLFWALCLLTAVRLVQRGERRDAFWLALAAGAAIYTYPTLKVAVPLIVGGAIILALLRHGIGAAKRWLAPALLLAILWLPFASVTLLNADSNMRAARKLLRADTTTEWVAQWWENYSVYMRPEFYYQTGDGANGIPNQGVELWVAAPLVLMGLAALAAHLIRAITTRRLWSEWWLIAAALLIAPLPASLTSPNPHLTRSLALAPIYALLAGMGLALFWHAIGRISTRQRAIQGLITGVLFGALLWQGWTRFDDYVRNYPMVVASKYQDGLREMVERAVVYAPEFDEIWIDSHLNFPYIYVLAAGGIAPEQVPEQIEVSRGLNTFNMVNRMGRYQFVDTKPLPVELPTLEAGPNSLGRPGYVLQIWQADGRRILVLRRMRDA